MHKIRHGFYSRMAFADWVLRGVGQIALQNSPRTGTVILAAILFNSWIQASVCLLGAIVSTVTAVVLKADKDLIESGQFGFNGALVGLALIAFTSKDLETGALPSVHMMIYCVFAMAQTTVAFSCIYTFLKPYKMPPLTAPLVLVGWLFLFAVIEFSSLGAGTLGRPTPEPFLVNEPYGLPTWYMGLGNGVGQIVLQDNWISGYLILIAIVLHSRKSGAMALLGVSIATLVAGMFGAPEAAIRNGMFGYSAALTAIALGGTFLVLTIRSLIYTVFGIITVTWLWASVTVFLSPIGMPALTAAFVIVTWLMLIGQDAFIRAT